MKLPFWSFVYFLLLINGCASGGIKLTETGDTGSVDTGTDTFVDSGADTSPDSDGSGVDTNAECPDADLDGHTAIECGGDDCNDADRSVYTGATEVCNGFDDNCDGSVDGSDSVDATTWYADVDSDNWGSGDAVVACTAPAGYVGNNNDCNDADFAINPGMAEICNGFDDNCDGLADGADAADRGTWYADTDGDGYGDAGVVIVACVAPSGYVGDATDCNDGRIDIHPGAEETDCKAEDATDYNCDGSVGSVDADGDGYGACAECDDGNSAVHPGEAEICDGLDNDCNGAVDGADAVDAVTWYADTDGDGYGDAGVLTVACTAPAGYAINAEDCDDADSAAYPGAPEVCTDTKDLNCDGSYGSADVDNDGYDACDECDDGDPAVNPGVTETCNSIDDNCDGSVDGSDSVDATTWYADTDGDGYGDSGVTLRACAGATGLSATGGDCDDGSRWVNPGVTEACNSIDDNCDGVVDEGCGGGDTGDTGVSVTVVFLEDFGDGGTCTVDPFVRNDAGSMASASYSDGVGECGVFVPGGGSAYGPALAIDYSAGGYVLKRTYLVLLEVTTPSTEATPTTFYATFGGGSVVSATVDPGAATMMVLATSVTSADNTAEVWTSASTNYAGVVLGLSISY